jgi:hypothetical protein
MPVTHGKKDDVFFRRRPQKSKKTLARLSMKK